MEAHDVYGLGEFKDDQLQNITGSLYRVACTGDGAFYGDTYGYYDGAIVSGNGYHNQYFDASRVARAGLVTHGKQKGINYIIHV